jgi:signal transduction histidine kinase
MGRDITERKLAQAQMENLHRQLLDISREAGMAEVATNVLHNVGNVLNSVNVSTALVSDKIRESRVSSLAKVVALMRAHQNNLAAFLTEDPKGMQLCDYLDNLARYLGKEQTGILKELESLNANIDHIKEIVTMQQSYARASGIVETLPIVDLVEDALRMNAGALARHDVQVVREYTAAPSVPVDKHKVLQILVNVVRNAKYALDDGGGKDKRLTIRVATDTDGLVTISVIDNGVGIPPENLTRVFSYGFTTRKDGHGFGLHSGAIAAKEMGGSLRAHSDGLGRGATFTLSLPLHQEHENL